MAETEGWQSMTSVRTTSIRIGMTVVLAAAATFAGVAADHYAVPADHTVATTTRAPQTIVDCCR
jgi:hypothetical protein